jgi:nucleotide-binding universal stress UspA family protein
VINRILVATDASAASNRALEMAAQFAVLNDAEMLIIHVIRDMQIPFEIDEIPELEFHQIESFNDARDEIRSEPGKLKPRSEPVIPQPVSSALPSDRKQK